MADSLHVFAVDAAAIPRRTRRLLKRAADPGRDPEGYAFEQAAEWLFDEPDGVRMVGGTFRPQYLVPEALAGRFARHIADPELRGSLCQARPGRVPPGADRNSALLGVQGWQVYRRAEMLELAAAIRTAEADDPDWFADVTGQGPEWRELAANLSSATEEVYVWAYWL